MFCLWPSRLAIHNIVPLHECTSCGQHRPGVALPWSGICVRCRSAVARHEMTLSGGVQDTDDMDYLLPQSITELGNCLMQLAATLIFVSIVQPIFLAGLSSSQCCLLSLDHMLHAYSWVVKRSCHELTVTPLNLQVVPFAGCALLTTSPPLLTPPPLPSPGALCSCTCTRCCNVHLSCAAG